MKTFDAHCFCSCFARLFLKSHARVLACLSRDDCKCLWAQFSVASTIRRDYPRYLGVDDMAVIITCCKGTLCDPKTWLNATQAPDQPRRAGRATFNKTCSLPSSLTQLIFPSLAANRASVYSLKATHTSILNSSSRPRSSPGGAPSPGSLLLGNYQSVFSRVTNSGGARQDRQGCTRCLICAEHLWTNPFICFVIVGTDTEANATPHLNLL